MSLNQIIRVGEKIRKLRIAKGITQKAMAEDILKIPRSTYSNYENDNRVPDKETLNLIAAVLGVEVSELLGMAQEKDSIIEKIRKSREMSIKTLANKCDISASYLYQIERGDKNPSVDTLKQIAEALNAPVSDLIDAKGEHGNKSIKDYSTDELLAELRSRLR